MIAFHPIYVHPLPENHRFPMEKYDLLPKQLVYEGTANEADFFEPGFLSEKHLLSVHTNDYWRNLNELKLSEREQRVSGFVHSKGLIDRERCIMEGTLRAAEIALTKHIAFNIAGGTHHAFADRGEGFCLLNDQVIATHFLLENHGIGKILIIDLDVHQGNGTAALVRNDERIFSFSMHGRNNYPLQKEQSDVDVELEDGIQDKEYLTLLARNLDDILNRFQPDFVFYQCGVDILATDKLGKLAVSMNGCRERDRFVFDRIRQLGVPVVCTMGGGYSPQTKDIVEAHAQTFRVGLNALL
ncbi:MAG: histone deacetylase [Crocinitomicaceae bacterium]|jgi:acetoin utilization deacetylase AcuC-like enzyme|nr:histone deacetylase [Crocinitomicaceae bacterium]